MLAIWSSNRAPSTSYGLLQATRGAFAGTFGTPTTTPLAALNDSRNRFDPHVSGDGLRLYYAPVVGSTQQIRLATRASRTDDFGAGQLLPIYDMPMIRTRRCRTTVASSTSRRGGGDLQLYATRIE